MYTSGRTVKGSKQPASPVTAATADVRRVVARLVATSQIAPGAHIVTRGTADPVTLAQQVRTSITFAHVGDAVVAAYALRTLPRIAQIITDPISVTIVRGV